MLFLIVTPDAFTLIFIPFSSFQSLQLVCIALLSSGEDHKVRKVKEQHNIQSNDFFS